MLEMNLNNLYLWGFRDFNFSFSKNDFDQVETSYQNLTSHFLKTDSKIYGIHTGFGKNVTSDKDPSDWKKTQTDLLNYLKVGSGPLFNERVVRRALRLQAYKVAQGFSGIHPQTFKDLIDLSHQSLLPEVPIWGSLGASGDLIPMAHAIEPLFKHQAPRSPRDVLGLVNTNSMMCSWAIENFLEVSRLVESSMTNIGLIANSVGVKDATFDGWGLKIQPQMMNSMQAGKKILQNSNHMLSKMGLNRKEIYNKASKNDLPIQEKYSLRCAPQVFGNILENLEFAEKKILNESLSVADNPIFDLRQEDCFFHGGLFYTSYLATAADVLNDVIGRLAEVLDRQVLILMDPILSHGLPENLNSEGDLHLKGIHQNISSLVQIIRSKSTPSRQMSFSCESNNQDIVPCSMNAFHLLNENVKVAEEVVRLSQFCATRAVYLRSELQLPNELKLTELKHFKLNQFLDHSDLVTTSHLKGVA